jgi:hypothetical protein
MPLIQFSNYEWNFQGRVGAFHEGVVDYLNMQARVRRAFESLHQVLRQFKSQISNWIPTSANLV